MPTIITSDPLLEFVEDQVSKTDYCLFSNSLIASKINMTPLAVQKGLTRLLKQDKIYICYGPPGDQFAVSHTRSRRIYKRDHPDVAKLPNPETKAAPPHPYDTRYPYVIDIIDRHVMHDKQLSSLGKLMYVEINLVAGDGSASMPPAYFSRAFGCTYEEAIFCLEELYAAGYIWYFNHESTILYGTIKSLWTELYFAAVDGDQDRLKRAKETLSSCTIYKGRQELKQAMKAKKAAWIFR